MSDEISIEPDLPQFPYSNRQYWRRGNNGIWVPVSGGDVRRELVALNYNPERHGGLSEVDEMISRLQTELSVAYTGPLAGNSEGVKTIEGGKRILVTESPAVIEPERGNWPTIRKLIDGMFGEEGEEGAKQTAFLFGWLHTFLGSLQITLKKGTWGASPMPGQALVMCGARDCGKTLLVKVLAKMLGDRRADPFGYMTGSTDFNSELAEAEFLVIDDQPASKDPRDRQRLSAKIKEFTVLGVMRVHAKYQVAISLPVFQRLVILLNDEPDNLMVLPPLEPSIEDKLIILRARRSPMPMPTETHAERTAFWEKLVCELPAFHHFLLHEYEIPEELRSGRFGVTHYHNPDLLSMLGELSAESRVMTMIDELFAKGLLESGVIPSDGDAELAGVLPDEDPSLMQPWRGTARDFEATMRAAFDRWEVDRLFRYSNSAGQVLGRLSMNFPSRVSKAGIVRGTARWEIAPPGGDLPK